MVKTELTKAPYVASYVAIVQKPAVYQSAGVFTCLVTEQGRGSMFPGFFTLQRLGTWGGDLHNLIKKPVCFLRKGRVHSELCPHDSVSGLSAVVAVTVSHWPWSLLSPAACDSVLGLVNGQWSPLISLVNHNLDLSYIDVYTQKLSSPSAV